MSWQPSSGWLGHEWMAGRLWAALAALLGNTHWLVHHPWQLLASERRPGGPWPACCRGSAVLVWVVDLASCWLVCFVPTVV